MPNVLISSEIGSEGRTISGRRQLIECIGICVLNLAHTPELGSSDVNLHIVKKKKISGNFPSNSVYASKDWPLLGF